MIPTTFLVSLDLVDNPHPLGWRPLLEPLDLVYDPAGLVQPSSEIDGGKKRLERVGPHLDLNVLHAVLVLHVAYSQSSVDVHAMLQNHVGYQAVVNLLLLEVGHLPF